MKTRILLGVLLLTLIVPQFALAAWWNPFSWFQRPSPTYDSESKQPEISETTVYTNNTANFRKCADIKCEPWGQYAVNTEIVLPYGNLNDVPEWVPIVGTNSRGISTSGFMHKSLFSTQKIDVAEIKNPVITDYNNRQNNEERNLLYNKIGLENLSLEESYFLNLKSTNEDLETAIKRLSKLSDSEVESTFRNIKIISPDLYSQIKLMISAYRKPEISEELSKESRQKLIREAEKRSTFKEAYDYDSFKEFEESEEELRIKLEPLEKEYQRLSQEAEEKGCIPKEGEIMGAIAGQLLRECESYNNKLVDITRQQSAINSAHYPTYGDYYKPPAKSITPAPRRWFVGQGKIWSPDGGPTYYYSCNKIECQIQQ